MEREITKDYMYLIVKSDRKLRCIEDTINLNHIVENILDDFVYGKENISQKKMMEFKNKVKNYYPDFFKSKSYAIRYNSAYECLGFPSSKCSVNEFKTEMYNYIYANALESLYENYENNSSIIAYSHRKEGFTDFSWKLDNTFKFDISTNFGYGASSYFHMLLYWKNLPIINYLHIVFYRFSLYYDVLDVTESYDLTPESWRRCFDNTIYYVNTFYDSGANNFVKKYLDDIFLQLVNGLWLNLHTNLYCALSNYDVDELFIKENYFSDLYLNANSEIGPNILLEKNTYSVDEILSIYNSDMKLQDIIKSQNYYAIQEDVDYVLEKFVNDYKSSKARLKQKAVTYIFMLNLSKILKFSEGNDVIFLIFNWLYNNLKAYNNYDDERYLYLVDDEYDLQIQRLNQCVSTIDSIKKTKNTEMNYIYNIYKNQLVDLINILKNQNKDLIKKITLEINEIQGKINEKEIQKETKFKLLEQKESYKHNCIYDEYFSILKDNFKNILIYENNEFLIQSAYNIEIFKKLNELKIKARECNFTLDNIINLENFALDNETYNIGNIRFNKNNIVEKYKDKKAEKEKNVLCSIVAIPKNVHQIITNMLQGICNDGNYKKVNGDLTKKIFENIDIIAKYNNINQLSNEQYTSSFKDIIENIYIKSFKLNSCSYGENKEKYQIDSKNYNEIKKEISQLTSDLNSLKNKITKLKEYKLEM